MFIAESSNYAFERTGEPSAQARVRRARHHTLAARWNALRPAAQCER
jgi:hypothetical protein